MAQTDEDTSERRKHWRDAAMWIIGIPLFFFVALIIKGMIDGPKTIGDFAEMEEQQCLDRIARDGWHPGPENQKITPEIYCAIKGYVKGSKMACDQWDEACR